MKVNFSQPLKDLEGNTLNNEKGKGVFLNTVCANALIASPENNKVDGVEKVKRYELAKKIMGGGDIDVSVEELALIKELLGTSYGVLVVGQAYKMLDK